MCTHRKRQGEREQPTTSMRTERETSPKPIFFMVPFKERKVRPLLLN